MLFSYIGRDSSGKPIKGEIETTSLREAESLLKGKNIYIIEVKRKITWSFRTRKISLRELVFVLQQLSSLLRSGFTMNSALTVVEENARNPGLRKILKKLREDVTGGISLSTALTKYGDTFPKIFVETVRVGETTGNLDVIFSHLAEFFTREEDLRGRIKNAFSYPLVILSVIAIAVVFLLFTLIPVFTKIYIQAGVTLPSPTRILVFLSNLMINNWWLIILIIILLSVLLKLFISTYKGRRFFDNLLFHMPTPLGRIYRGSIFLRVTISLEILLKSGVLLTESLLLLSKMSGNTVIEEALNKSREGVLQGRSFGNSLRDTRIFPNLLTRMVAVGEESGRLENSLSEVSKHIEREMDYDIRGFLVKLEPALTLVMGAIVAFVALAIYLPFFDMAKLVGR